eukprot:5963510-Pleurochrysis_carterae.AAC.2
MSVSGDVQAKTAAGMRHLRYICVDACHLKTSIIFRASAIEVFLSVPRKLCLCTQCIYPNR